MTTQCRTMLSQRPCGNSQCTREECSRATQSALAFMDATKQGTENGSTGSESDERTTEVQEPTYTLERLSARDVERIEQALRMLRRTFTRDSAGYREI